VEGFSASYQTQPNIMDNFDELDIDTSDLESFLKRCNSNTTIIPGPAGNVQAVLLNRTSHEPLSTQQFVKDLREESHRQDFGTNAWEWAQMFIDFHGKFLTITTATSCEIEMEFFLSGLVDGQNTMEVTPLAKRKTSMELKLLPCIVKACQPNGLGDMKITVTVNIIYYIHQNLSLFSQVTHSMLLYPTGSHWNC